MDLQLYFTGLSGFELNADERDGFAGNIKINNSKMPDLKGMDIAIFSVEADGEDHVSIRQKLYGLKRGYGRYRIADIGHLRNGVNQEQTLKRVAEICHYLIDRNILPIIIGDQHELDLGQYEAYQGFEKLVSFLNVDAFFDMDDTDSDHLGNSHVRKIMVHEPNYLFNYCHLGYQTYLVDRHAIETLEKLYFETYRIGEIRSDFKDTEPIIRNSDLLSFDVCAIKSADFPGSHAPQPFGLTGEEACQISWYAGINEKLSSVGFYGYNKEKDDDNLKSAQVLATMVWYFIEGFYHRKNEKNFKGNDYVKYVVSMPAEPETLSFYRSKLSEKWWMEVPVSEELKSFDHCIVPCSYTDYEKATKGELPDRYIQTNARYI